MGTARALSHFFNAISSSAANIIGFPPTSMVNALTLSVYFANEEVLCVFEHVN